MGGSTALQNGLCAGDHQLGKQSRWIRSGYTAGKAPDHRRGAELSNLCRKSFISDLSVGA